MNNRRLPALDGLRAVSIVLVLLGHLTGTVGYSPPGLISRIPSAHLGVRLFFVISGFLITRLLMDEMSRRGRIDLPLFYLRRAWRLMPAFAVYVGCVVAASQLGWVTLLPGDLLCALTYTMNYHHPRAWVVGHLWSLSVEEQFYLLWPGVVAALGIGSATKTAILALGLVPIIRVLEWLCFPNLRVGLGESFESAADALAVGCLLALSRDWLHATAWYRRIFRGHTTFLLLLVIWGLDSLTKYPSISLTVGETLMNVGLAVVLDWCLLNPSGLIGYVLNTAPLVYLGRLSYSIYLWQQPFLNRESTHIFTAFPLNLATALLCAVASYHFVEQPFLRLRDSSISRPEGHRERMGESS